MNAQQAQEDEVRKAEAELQAAINDLKKQEEDYRNQIQTLETKANDPAASTVNKSKVLFYFILFVFFFLFKLIIR